MENSNSDLKTIELSSTRYENSVIVQATVVDLPHRRQSLLGDPQESDLALSKRVLSRLDGTAFPATRSSLEAGCTAKPCWATNKMAWKTPNQSQIAGELKPVHAWNESVSLHFFYIP
ncbi:hypothetical protein CC80DRAFT_487344 [Byssothecium circinans]|uniref:Uncharacterized protein n=1 Tax=Byssothecium circinans TaxID=147558 RepID=A0A6A5UCJ9_9PLEO|nr:hypothetical protein CC80DRAFT_487344 [Byssothecium circinans]